MSSTPLSHPDRPDPDHDCQFVNLHFFPFLLFIIAHVGYTLLHSLISSPHHLLASSSPSHPPLISPALLHSHHPETNQAPYAHSASHENMLLYALSLSFSQSWQVPHFTPDSLAHTPSSTLYSALIIPRADATRAYQSPTNAMKDKAPSCVHAHDAVLAPIPSPSFSPPLQPIAEPAASHPEHSQMQAWKPPQPITPCEEPRSTAEL
jgi:hypothetical protein